jgi:hypothetical protein
MYAMGKTLYEVLFCIAAGSEPSGKVAIMESEATEQPAKFRAVLDGKEAGSRSRLHMSMDARDALLMVIYGLCRQDQPISFKEADKLLGM